VFGHCRVVLAEHRAVLHELRGFDCDLSRATFMSRKRQREPSNPRRWGQDDRGWGDRIVPSAQVRAHIAKSGQEGLERDAHTLEAKGSQVQILSARPKTASDLRKRGSEAVLIFDVQPRNGRRLVVNDFATYESELASSLSASRSSTSERSPETSGLAM
jgi:hypothetical protein